MATFLVTHGAWSAGFVWKKMRPLMRAAGHEMFTPSHTGLGDRRHLAHKDVDLETHISDISAVLFQEDLNDVYLIGHSYGGIVARCVADRMAERLAHVIYLDSFVPHDGQSMLDMAIPAQRERWLKGAAEEGAGWLVPPNPLPGDTSEEDVAWIAPRRHPQPLKTIVQPARLGNHTLRIPQSYIYCTRAGPGDMFGPFARAAKADPAWGYFELDASHSPHVTAPDALMTVLNAIVAGSKGR